MVESQFKEKVKVSLKKCPKLHFFKVSDRFTAGIPDFLVCHKGNFVGLELKIDDRKVTEIQMHFGRQILLAGGRYIVLRYINKTNRFHTDEFHAKSDVIESIDLDYLEDIMLYLGLKEERNGE